jgi:hypothetical protein
MITKPRLKSFLTIFPLGESTWGLRGGADELWRVKLRDEGAFAVFTATLPYLDGRRTADEMLDLLAAKGVDREEVRQLLDRLEEASLLEEADDSGLPAEAAREFASQISFFSRYTASGGAGYQVQLAARRIAVVGQGYLARSLARQFAASGFGEVFTVGAEADAPGGADGDGWRGRLRWVPLDRERIWPEEAGPPPDLVVVAQEAEDPQLLAAIDAFAERRRVPWLLVRALEPLVGWIGPLFVADETASYRDLQARLAGNLQFFPEHQALDGHLRARGGPGSPCGGLHSFFELLAAVAVIEAVKFTCNLVVPYLAGRFVTINLSNWDSESHDVLRIPRLGLDPTEPTPFAWKELAYDDIDAHREGEIYSRRS